MPHTPSRLPSELKPPLGPPLRPPLWSAAWPRPADPLAGERLAERFAALDPGGAVPVALLHCLGGNAPFLADLAQREPASLRATMADGPDKVVAAVLADIRALPPHTARDRVAAAVRRAKRIVALATAVADIGGVWRLERVTAVLSELAEVTLGLVAAHLLRTAHDAGELVLPDPDAPARGSGFVALGMGKLGAGELNYSSDIDLILLHDPAAGVYRGDAAGAFFSRLARTIVTLMEARDADGYVFRTDLRLRPDPASTPPCMSLSAAIAYYESMGQNWERAAMLKARPVAGDLATGAAFLDAVRPFVWRRHLDFAAFADIHAMKRRIDAHKGTALAQSGALAAQVAGHNVKLGQGGIREIEFLAQTLQLVWGGRDPALRARPTRDALRLLVRAGHLRLRAAGELAAAYRFLRGVEHRLQMVADRQTHELPATPAGVAAFALFMGYPDADSFAAALLTHLRRVQRRYRDVFEQLPASADDAPARLDFTGLDFTGVGEPPPQTVQALAALGFADPAAVFALVHGWQAGRARALRTARARELMAQVLPALLAAFARQRDPMAALARFDAFLWRLPAGVQLFSLFQRNPFLLGRVAAVLGAAPMLSEHLACTPSAIEGLLAPADLPPDYPAVLANRLTDARALEDSIAIVRATVREEDFALSVATLEGRMDADAAGLLRSALADAAIAALLPRVLDDFAQRFGQVPGGGLAVVLLGKAGGREMMAGSDLDLMLIYDHAPDATESVGARPVAPSQWFVRAVNAFIAALTAPDAAGPLYAVDMRLRPSGNKGPVAVALSAFVRYHASGEAWTWERMALTRARVVAGPAGLRERVQAAITAALAQPVPPAKVLADAAAMRARLLRDLPPSGPWDVKHRAGGQMEVEFVAQALQLAHPEAGVEPTTRLALARLRQTGALPPEDAALLIRADRVWRTVQGMLRLTEGRDAQAALSGASAQALLRAVAEAGLAGVDAAALRSTLDDLADAVRAAFVRNVGVPEP